MTDTLSLLRKYNLNKREESEDEDEEPEFKRFKYSSSKGSSLKSLLPPPKKATVKTTSFLPDVLKRKASASIEPSSTSSTSTKPVVAKKLIDYDDEDDEQFDFFSFDQDQKKSSDNSPQIQTVQSDKFETDLIERNFVNTSSSIRSSNETSSNQSAPLSTNPETDYQKDRRLKYEIEKKFGEEVGDDVRIQEVNIASHLNDNLDYIKTLSEERDVEVKGPAPSSLAKRKHQITYLAYQAKQNELKLKKEWAQGRINRDLARSKYGF